MLDVERSDREDVIDVPVGSVVPPHAWEELRLQMRGEVFLAVGKRPLSGEPVWDGVPQPLSHPALYCGVQVPADVGAGFQGRPTRPQSLSAFPRCDVGVVVNELAFKRMSRSMFERLYANAKRGCRD